MAIIMHLQWPDSYKRGLEDYLYYEEENGLLFCGDCLDILAKLPDESIDLVVTSPPYEELRSYQGYTFDYQKVIAGLYHPMKQGGVIVWVVGDQTIDGSETGTSFKQALFFLSTGFNLHDTMIYEKAGPRYPESNRYYQVFEYMFIFSKGNPEVVNLIKDRENRWGSSWGNQSIRYKDGKLRQKGKYESSYTYGVRFNIWRYNNGYGFSAEEDIAYEHPAIFPESLARDHVISWSNSNDVVLDPMCGSGTTCKMAKLNNRKFIGVDISSDYLSIAKERLRQEVLPLKVKEKEETSNQLLFQI